MHVRITSQALGTMNHKRWTRISHTLEAVTAVLCSNFP